MSRWLAGEPIRVGGSWWRPTWRFRYGARYQIGPAWSPLIAEVPAGFVFDVSAPLLLVPLLRLLGWFKLMVGPAGLHDFARQDPTWSLWFGDLIFVDAMKAAGAREPALTVCWWGVRSNNNRAPAHRGA